MGIYGFLTSAFQDTYNQFNIKEKQISFLQQKEEFWGGDVQDMMKNLKESLIIFLLSLMQGHNKSKYETPRWLGALEPRYPRVSYA